MIRVVDTGVGAPQTNMDWDAAALADLDPTGPPILHLYDWEGSCATHGYFLNPQVFLREGVVSLGKRPTGGGIIFHVSDLAFSILLPAGHPGYSVNTLANYKLINEIVASAIARFMGWESNRLELLAKDPVGHVGPSGHFCMAKPTQYDVMAGGRKVGGAAQRRTRRGFLHQGSISLAPPPEPLLQAALLPETRVWQDMQAWSYCLLDRQVSVQELTEARRELRSLLEQETQSTLLASCCLGSGRLN